MHKQTVATGHEDIYNLDRMTFGILRREEEEDITVALGLDDLWRRRNRLMHI